MILLILDFNNFILQWDIYIPVWTLSMRLDNFVWRINHIYISIIKKWAFIFLHWSLIFKSAIIYQNMSPQFLIRSVIFQNWVKFQNIIFIFQKVSHEFPNVTVKFHLFSFMLRRNHFYLRYEVNTYYWKTHIRSVLLILGNKVSDTLFNHANVG